MGLTRSSSFPDGGLFQRKTLAALRVLLFSENPTALKQAWFVEFSENKNPQPYSWGFLWQRRTYYKKSEIDKAIKPITMAK